MKYTFKKLKDSDIDLAYDLHCELVNDMLNRGIKQWLRPIDKCKVLARQEKNENYGLFNQKGVLKVFLSLVARSDYHEWDAWFTIKPTTWLNTVSVNINNSKKGLGQVAIKEACSYLKGEGEEELYLDCVVGDGFLINYYQKLGFVIIGETRATYRSGTFDLVLMKKSL